MGVLTLVAWVYGPKVSQQKAVWLSEPGAAGRDAIP